MKGSLFAQRLHCRDGSQCRVVGSLFTKDIPGDKTMDDKSFDCFELRSRTVLSIKKNRFGDFYDFLPEFLLSSTFEWLFYGANQDCDKMSDP